MQVQHFLVYFIIASVALSFLSDEAAALNARDLDDKAINYETKVDGAACRQMDGTLGRWSCPPPSHICSCLA